MPSKLIIALAATTIALAPAHGQANDLYTIQIERIGNGVYAAYRRDPLRYWVEGNATIIINEQDVVVVDAGGTPISATNTIAHIKKLTNKPVRYLINTHDHVDHTLGNQVYAKAYPGLEIISHPRARDALDTDGRTYVARQIVAMDSVAIRGPALYQRLRDERTPNVDKVIDYWRRYERYDSRPRQDQYRQVTITLPTLTVESSLVLHRGKRTIEIRHIGHGDTPGDLVVFLPQDSIVATGDMVTEPVPYGFTTNPVAWVETLTRLAELPFHTMVPGHGAVQRDKVYLRRLIEMEKSLQEQVARAVADGLDLDATRRRVDLSAFRSYFTKGDAVAEYRFDGWYQRPAVGEAFRVIKVKSP